MILGVKSRIALRPAAARVELTSQGSSDPLRLSGSGRNFGSYIYALLVEWRYVTTGIARFGSELRRYVGAQRGIP